VENKRILRLLVNPNIALTVLLEALNRPRIASWGVSSNPIAPLQAEQAASPQSEVHYLTIASPDFSGIKRESAKPLNSLASLIAANWNPLMDRLKAIGSLRDLAVWSPNQTPLPDERLQK